MVCEKHIGWAFLHSNAVACSRHYRMAVKTCLNKPVIFIDVATSCKHVNFNLHSLASVFSPYMSQLDNEIQTILLRCSKYPHRPKNFINAVWL